MKRIASILIALGLLALPVLAADTKKETKESPAEIRANAAFEKGDYKNALPVYLKLAQEFKDQPDKAGPIQEKIKVCQTNLAKTDPQAAAGDRSGGVKTSPEERKQHVRPKDDQPYAVSIKELGNFDYDGEKGGNIPEDVKKLDGAKIRTRGFMIPLDQADKITEFALVSDLFACCFGQPPQVQHTLVVHAPKGKAVSYFPDEINVEGTLRVNEKKEDGIIVSVFEIDCISVKPAPK